MRIIYLFFLSFLLFPCCVVRASNEEAESFIRFNVEKIIEIISLENIPSDQRYRRLSDIFYKIVDVRGMAQFALGPQWKQLNQKQQEDYLNLYKKYLTCRYLSKFYQYSDYKNYSILKVEAVNKHLWSISTTVANEQNSSQKFHISYRVRKGKDNQLKVIDIVNEGISMLTTQRADFSSTIMNHGIEDLLSALAKKIQSCNG